MSKPLRYQPHTEAKVEVPSEVRRAVALLGTPRHGRLLLHVSPEIYRELAGPCGRVTQAALERVRARLAELSDVDDASSSVGAAVSGSPGR